MFRTALILICLICSATSAWTPIVNEDYKLIASNGSADDWFGSSVSISGDVAVVGAPRSHGPPEDSGTAYIFRLNDNEWIEEAILLPSDSSDFDRFGSCVSIDSDTLLIAAAEAKAVYVFRLKGTKWVEEAKFESEDSGFGYSVSIDGNVAVIGSFRDNENGVEAGAAYVYRFNGKQWIEEAKLLASDGQWGHYYGLSVSVSENAVLIGAPGHDESNTNAGAAYIFRFDGVSWIEEAKLIPSGFLVGAAQVGQSVSLSGPVALIGSSGDDDYGDQAGAAYVYRFDDSTWVQETKLLAGDGMQNDHFGSFVSVDANNAIIGVPHHDANGVNSGAAYFFHFGDNGWSRDGKLVPSDNVPIHLFGEGVSVSGDIGFVGAFYDDENAIDAGAAYIFTLPIDLDNDGIPTHLDNCYLYNPDQLDCNLNGVGDVCDIADGYSLDINLNEIPDDCECIGDIALDDGQVNVHDLLSLIAVWGTDSSSADINYDGIVNIHDLLVLIGAWGPCE